MYVDNAAMQIIRAPTQFDTIVTGNIFGDILSGRRVHAHGLHDLPLRGGGHLRSALRACTARARHAGTDKANPLARVLSAMMRYQFGEEEAAAKIERRSRCSRRLSHR